MKPLKTFGIFLALTTGILACEPIRGTLQVQHALTVKSGNSTNCPAESYPCPELEKTVTLKPGSYSMNLDVLGQNTVRIYLKTDRKTLNIELSIPSGDSIPATGSFTLASSQSGQPFDLHGQSQTDVSRTSETQTRESCQIARTERICGLKPGTSGQGPVHACWTETFYRDGIEDVRYYFQTTVQNMQAQLVQSGTQAASFSGSRTSTNKIYTYRGGCFENSPFSFRH